MVDNQLSLVLTYLTFGLPLSIKLLKGFYDNIPEEFGAGGADRRGDPLRGLLADRMPFSSPGIIATGIFVFIGAWNEYVYATSS